MILGPVIQTGGTRQGREPDQRKVSGMSLGKVMAMTMRRIKMEGRGKNADLRQNTVSKRDAGEDGSGRKEKGLAQPSLAYRRDDVG